MHSAYQNLSRYRSELMGLAILWVMLFHAYEFHFFIRPLDAFKGIGFAGVDVFILLSAMGLYVSLSRASERKSASTSSFFLRRFVRILPAYWLVVGLYSLWLIWRGQIGWRTALWSLSTLHYWFHIPDTFNWYIPAILAFYLLAPLYARLFRRCPRKEWMTAIMFPLSYGLYRLSIPLHLNYTEDFVCRIPAFALGILMGHYLVTGQSLTRRHTAVWVMLSLLGVAVTALRLMNRLYISPCYLIAAQLVPLTLLTAKVIDLLPLQRIRSLLWLLGYVQPGDLPAECHCNAGICRSVPLSGLRSPPCVLLSYGLHRQSPAGHSVASGAGTNSSPTQTHQSGKLCRLEYRVLNRKF